MTFLNFLVRFLTISFCFTFLTGLRKRSNLGSSMNLLCLVLDKTMMSRSLQVPSYLGRE